MSMWNEFEKFQRLSLMIGTKTSFRKEILIILPKNNSFHSVTVNVSDLVVWVNTIAEILHSITVLH
jgi:hypothetical protein